MSVLDNRIYYLNSENRLSGTSSNFLYSIDIPENPAGSRFDSVCVLSMTIPRSYYLVRDLYNKFKLVLDGVEHELTVAPGNYGARNFADTVTPLLNGVGGTWTMTYSTITGKYSYSVTGLTATTIQFKFEAPSRMGLQMGFDEVSINTFSSAKLDSVNVVDFVSTSTLFLHSDMVDDQTSVLQEVYAENSIPFSNLVYNCKFPAMYSKTLKNATSGVFSFSLVDEHDKEVDLNGHDILVTLLLYKRENLTRLMKAIFTRDG